MKEQIENQKSEKGYFPRHLWWSVNHDNYKQLVKSFTAIFHLFSDSSEFYDGLGSSLIDTADYELSETNFILRALVKCRTEVKFKQQILIYTKQCFSYLRPVKTNEYQGKLQQNRQQFQ